jgi:DNA uptake protein ComE-like DNA-binding protein
VIAFLGMASAATAAMAAETPANAPVAPAPGTTAASQPAPAPAAPPITTSAPKKPGAAATTPAAAPPALPQGAAPPATQGTKQAQKAPAKPAKKIDLNNASLAELQTLPTVGEADAKRIIANRPYKSKGELVTRAGLPQGVYQAIKYKVELQKPRNPAPKK